MTENQEEIKRETKAKNLNESKPTTKEECSEGTSESKKIMVVEDTRAMRRILSMGLAKKNYIILEAENGKEALEMARLEKPDLILLDIMMPVMDGIEFLKKKKTDPMIKDIPVMMCTAKSERDIVIECIRLGIVDYIVKPYKMENVLAKIQKFFTKNKDKKERDVDKEDEKDEK